VKENRDNRLFRFTWEKALNSGGGWWFVVSKQASNRRYVHPDSKNVPFPPLACYIFDTRERILKFFGVKADTHYP